MKKMVMIIAMMMIVGASTLADAGWMGSLWQDIGEDSEIHVFDNLVPATFYDLDEKEWVTGAVMSVYQYKGFYLDAGVLDTGGVGSPVGGLNYDLTPLVKKFIVPDFLNEGLMQNLYVGMFGSKDFSEDRWLYGVYTGIKFEFKKE